MANVVIRYDLRDPDDRYDYKVAMESQSVRRAVQDMLQWLRKQYKYDAGEINFSSDEENPVDLGEAGLEYKSAAAWSISSKFYDILREYDVDIDY